MLPAGGDDPRRRAAAKGGLAVGKIPVPVPPAVLQAGSRWAGKDHPPLAWRLIRRSGLPDRFLCSYRAHDFFRGTHHRYACFFADGSPATYV